MKQKKIGTLIKTHFVVLSSSSSYCSFTRCSHSFLDHNIRRCSENKTRTGPLIILNVKSQKYGQFNRKWHFSKRFKPLNSGLQACVPFDVFFSATVHLLLCGRQQHNIVIFVFYCSVRRRIPFILNFPSGKWACFSASCRHGGARATRRQQKAHETSRAAGSLSRCVERCVSGCLRGAGIVSLTGGAAVAVGLLPAGLVCCEEQIYRRQPDKGACVRVRARFCQRIWRRSARQ